MKASAVIGDLVPAQAAPEQLHRRARGDRLRARLRPSTTTEWSSSSCMSPAGSPVLTGASPRCVLRW